MVEKLVPKPGEGPSPESQEKGFYDIRFVGRTEDGKTLITKVTGDRDPGYGSTGKMLGESGMCLAFDVKDEVPGGFWTPASALNGKLLERRGRSPETTRHFVLHIKRQAHTGFSQQGRKSTRLSS